MTNANPKKKRPSIPARVAMQLWNSSAGRCQFQGCNKPLWYNGLTFSKIKIGEMAHIIGVSGARANDKSLDLAQKHENLMLLCKDCHLEIDRDEGKYTPQLLREWKENQEERVQMLLDLSDNLKCSILKFKANIGNENSSEINFEDIKTALFENDKHYPAGRNFVTNIDLTTTSYSTEQLPWDFYNKTIEEQLSQLQKLGERQGDPKKLAVFAIAPIPLLIKLGNHLPKTIPLNIYQRDRITGEWVFNRSNKFQTEYQITRKKGNENLKEVVVVINLSGNIINLPQTILSKDLPSYTINSNKKIPGLSQSQEEIRSFLNLWMEIQKEVLDKYGTNAVIHLFPIVPNAIAVELGNKKLNGISPELKVYEFNKNTKEYFHAITI